MAVSKSASLTLSQEANAVKSYGAWEITLSASSLSVAAAGGSSALTAQRRRLRTYTSGGTDYESGTSPALSLSGSGFSLSGSSVTATNNCSTASRSAVVTATFSGTASKTLTLTQSPGVKVPSDTTFDLVEGITNAPWTMMYNISCNIDHARTNYTWNGVAGSGGSEVSSNTSASWSVSDASCGYFYISTGQYTTFNLFQNTSPTARQFHIRATLDGVTKSYLVTQQGNTGSVTFKVPSTSQGVILLKDSSEKGLLFQINPGNSASIPAAYPYRLTTVLPSGKVLGYFYIGDAGEPNGKYADLIACAYTSGSAGGTFTLGVLYGNPITSLSLSPATIAFSSSDGLRTQKYFYCTSSLSDTYVYPVDEGGGAVEIIQGGLQGRSQVLHVGPTTGFNLMRLRLGVWSCRIRFYGYNASAERVELTVMNVSGG